MKTILSRPSIRIFLLLFFCALITASPAAAQVAIKFGNSYVNLSKRNVGGTIQPGDTLEIRTNYYFPNSYNGGRIYRVRYVDNIPSNTVYIGDSLRLITNEGLTYFRYTNAAADDAATYIASPTAGQYNIRINIGATVSAPSNNTAENINGSGTVQMSSYKPKVGGGILITTAFRVRVTGNIGDTITLGAGKLLYKKSSSGSAVDTIVNANRYQMLIANNDPICNNSIGKNFVAEAGGSFDSGYAQNRSYGPSFMIPNYVFKPLTSSDQIGDGSYTIVNNLSPYASTYVNAQKRPSCPTPAGSGLPHPASCANRMFGGHWDIMGDHTGSTTPAGNPPAASGTQGGYMLVVNADYATSEAYRQNITGLCPNTSYEFSLWVKNVCTNCGINADGAATWGPGVLPNLTFAIDGLDRYSSGQIDTIGWVKKGFLFKTGEDQTSITISIRNNASGGGGNDWAIDDIALVTCNPDLNLVPSGNANVCYGNQVDISCTVNAFFDNYTSYRFEKSTDHGATWTVAGSGTAIPVYNNGTYEYTASLPPFLANVSTHLNQYRFVVASSADNLSSESCSFLASTIIHVWVNDCMTVLQTKLTGFTGQLVQSKARLNWTVSNEQAGAQYVIERKIGASGYLPIATILAGSAPTSAYQFTDPETHDQPVGYRIRIVENERYQLSQEVQLSPLSRIGIYRVMNPFHNEIRLQLNAPDNGRVTLSLMDLNGKMLLQRNIDYTRGSNALSLAVPASVKQGSYILRVQTPMEVIHKNIVRY